MKFIILDYIKKIKKSDISYFMAANNIYLSEYEIDNLYILLQDKNILEYDDDEYKTLIYNNVSSKNYQKSYDLFMQYKRKYQNYI